MCDEKASLNIANQKNMLFNICVLHYSKFYGQESEMTSNITLKIDFEFNCIPFFAVDWLLFVPTPQKVVFSVDKDSN